MRIVFVSFEEPFFLPEFFSTILKVHRDKVVGCVIHPYRKNLLTSIREIIHMFSLLERTKLALLYIYRRCLALLSPHHSASVAGTMKRYGVHTYFVSSLNSAKTKDILTSLNPDVVIAQTSQYVPENLLNIPRWGWLNKHASLLPKYRGLHPLFWALYYDEPTLGVTIYQMTNILDHGSILAQKKVLVPKNTSIFTLYSNVFQVGTQLINQVLSRRLRFTDVLNLDPTVHKTPNREQVRAFRKKGYSMV